MDFEFYIKKLLKKIDDQDLMIKEAINQLDELSKENEKLEKENKELKELLLKTQGNNIRKTSRNSNLPPSSDIGRTSRKKSLRKKSNLKSGGQPGHKGSTLKWNSSPNKIIPCIPKSCCACGKHLNVNNKLFSFAKQEIDLPPIKPIITQFNSYEIKCTCGKNNKGKLPARLKARVQYGPFIRTWINYLSVYQFVPYKRLKEFLNVGFGINISQGTIFNTIKRSAAKMNGIYQSIQEFITVSNIVGADETIIFVNGKKWYNWVWQNKKATFITCENNRRKDNIYKYFPHGFPNATLISDRYSAHLSTPAKAHQICWVHILRHLIYLQEAEPNLWINQLKELFRKAKHLQNLKSVNNRQSLKAKYLEQQFNQLLLCDIDKAKFPDSFLLRNSLIKNRDAILCFIYDKSIPYHNNGSELAIRNAKVKMKISGCFKSAQKHYAVIRSVVDTLIKNNKPIFCNLLRIEQQLDITLGF